MKFNCRNLLVATALLASSALSYAQRDVCYRLSKDGINWSRTPEKLCVHFEEDDTANVQIDLKTGFSSRETVLASYFYEQLPSIPTLQYFAPRGIATNSLFKSMDITIEGIFVNANPSSPDVGKCSIGLHKYFCVKLKN